MQNTFIRVIAAGILSLLMMCPFISYADSHDHDHHDTGHHDRSHISFVFSVWPNNDYYSAPYYPSADEVLVSEPIYQPIVINGITYYLNNGTYYVYNGYGYQAVASPVMVVQQPVTILQPPAIVDSNNSPSIGTVGDIDSITINIPDKKGGYIAVIIKKSKNGFIGPQGEFYSEFPKVAQLEVIYGK